MNRLFSLCVNAMRLGQYLPVLDPASQRCLRSLPWWGGPGSRVVPNALKLSAPVGGDGVVAGAQWAGH
jgi:hypothetical protein